MCAKCNQLLIFLDANSRPRAPASVHSRVNKIMLGQRRKAGSGQRRPQLHRKKPDVSFSGRRGPRARIVYDIAIFEHTKKLLAMKKEQFCLYNNIPFSLLCLP